MRRKYFWGGDNLGWARRAVSMPYPGSQSAWGLLSTCIPPMWQECYLLFQSRCILGDDLPKALLTTQPELSTAMLMESWTTWNPVISTPESSIKTEIHKQMATIKAVNYAAHVQMFSCPNYRVYRTRQVQCFLVLASRRDTYRPQLGNKHTFQGNITELNPSRKRKDPIRHQLQF